MEMLVLIGARALGLILSLLIAATIRRRNIRQRRRKAALAEGEQIQARLELLAVPRARTGEHPAGIALLSRR